MRFLSKQQQQNSAKREPVAARRDLLLLLLVLVDAGAGRDNTASQSPHPPRMLDATPRLAREDSRDGGGMIYPIDL